MNDMALPWWSVALMLAGLAFFIALLVISVRRNRGIRRPLFAMPYTLWMILFTVLPCILIAYYAFVDTNGAFTLDNFRNFWDSNWSMKKIVGPEIAATIPRGSVNVDTLVYSLWMVSIMTSVMMV